MAKYRQVHVEFWQDGFVLDLTPEEKYFYLYLMTNSKTTQCGIYELPKRIIETETGYNRETVDKLLKRFIDYGKIKYDEETKEIMIINWIKYNAIRSSKVVACIKKELEEVKNKEFVRTFIKLCKRYGYPIDTLSIDYGEEQEEEQEKEKEKEEEKEQQLQQEEEERKRDDVVVNVFQFYEENFGVINSFLADEISYWVDDVGEELVIEAMKRALRQQKKWNYATGILKNWVNNNIRTLSDVKALDNEFSRRKVREGETNETDQYANLF